MFFTHLFYLKSVISTSYSCKRISESLSTGHIDINLPWKLFGVCNLSAIRQKELPCCRHKSQFVSTCIKKLFKGKNTTLLKSLSFLPHV